MIKKGVLCEIYGGIKNKECKITIKYQKDKKGSRIFEKTSERLFLIWDKHVVLRAPQVITRITEVVEVILEKQTPSK